MEEEELDLWFDEEKEKLSEAYQKRVAKLLVSEEIAEDKKISELTVEEREKGKEQVEKEYLEEIGRLRERYRKEYGKIRSRKERKKHASAAKGYLGTGFSFLFGPIWRIIKVVIGGTWKGVGFVFRAFFKGLKKTIADIRYRWRNLYEFRLKRHLGLLLWIRRKLKVLVVRPLGKAYERSKDIRKQTITQTKALSVKAFTKTLALGKTIWGKFMEKYKKVAGVVGKVWKLVSGIFKKVLGPPFSIIGKFLANFKKKEDEEE